MPSYDYTATVEGADLRDALARADADAASHFGRTAHRRVGHNEHDADPDLTGNASKVVTAFYAETGVSKPFLRPI